MYVLYREEVWSLEVHSAKHKSSADVPLIPAQTIFFLVLVYIGRHVP